MINLRCSFCPHTIEDVDILFVSRIGGTKTAICSVCVDGMAALLAERRAARVAEPNAETAD